MLQMEGMDKLLNELRKLEQKGGQTEENAVKEGAEVIRSAIESNSPRSPYGGQHMQDNIVTSDFKKREGVDIGPEQDFFYALFIELGTSKMSARPFVEPAFRSSINAARRKMEQIVKERLGL